MEQATPLRRTLVSSP